MDGGRGLILQDDGLQRKIMAEERRSQQRKLSVKEDTKNFSYFPGHQLTFKTFQLLTQRKKIISMTDRGDFMLIVLFCIWSGHKCCYRPGHYRHWPITDVENSHDIFRENPKYLCINTLIIHAVLFLPESPRHPLTYIGLLLSKRGLIYANMLQ